MHRRPPPPPLSGHCLGFWALALVACSDSPDEQMPVEPRQLIGADAWTVTPVDADAFTTFLPGRTACGPDDYGPTDFGGVRAFEIHTDPCNYLTIEQPLDDEVAAGEYVNVRLWHFALNTGKPATGYLGVHVQGAVQWEYETPIPAEGKLVSSGWVTDAAISAGTVVQFHVHNHGRNSWNLLEITAEPGDQAPD